MNLLDRFSFWRFGVDWGLTKFVKKHLRNGGSAGEYRFRFRRGAPSNYLSFWSQAIYCDAQYTIVLVRRTFPFLQYLACIGFNTPVVQNMTAEPGVIEVVQIQGVRGRQRELEAIRWDRLLLDMLVTLARESGFKEIRVQASRCNHWREGRNHLRYDVLPKRMGFTPGEHYHALRLNV